MADGNEAEGTVEEMAAAIRSANGATATPPPASETTAASTEADATDAESDDGQPTSTAEKADAKPDPFEALKQYGTPEEIRERLEKIEEERANAKAMRREASQRNEMSAREKAEADELRREIKAMHAQNRALVDAAALAFQEGNDQYGAQLMRMVAAQAGPMQPANPQAGAPMQGSAEVAELKQKLAAMEAQQQQYFFGDGVSRVTQVATNAVARLPIFQDPELKALGVPKSVVQEVVASVIQAAKEDATSVNVWDPDSLEAAVSKALKSKVDFHERLKNAHIKGYRAERKAKNGQVPPTGKGPAASVRGAPQSSLPDIPKGLSRREEDDLFIKATAAAMRAVKPAMEV